MVTTVWHLQPKGDHTMARKAKKQDEVAVEVNAVSSTPETSVSLETQTEETTKVNTETVATPTPSTQAQATKVGAGFHVLAGKPSKPEVVETFGKSGYSLSWVSRAAKLGITPEALCETFKTDRAKVKSLWADAIRPKAVAPATEAKAS